MTVLVPEPAPGGSDRRGATAGDAFADDDAHGRAEARRLVRRAVFSYLAASLGALLLVGVGAIVVAGQVAASAAVRDAAVYTRQFAELVVAPQVTQSLVDGEPSGVAALDRVVQLHMDEHEVLRVKVWSTRGAILYSDEPRLIGRTYPIDPGDLEVMHTHGVDAHLSASTKAENEFESGFGETLEVYAGVTAANGDTVLVEAYLPADRLYTLRANLVRQITPLVVLSLLALELLLLPLAVVLARRIARGQEERAVLSRLANHAAGAERRSIAAELHDGVVQDLVAVGFGLGTLHTVAQRSDQADVSAAARQLNDIIRDDVRVLRGMISSLAVADLAASALDEVVTAAALDAERAGIAVRREIQPVDDVSREAHTALCLVAREAIRNAVRHAGASTMTVRLTRDGDDATLDITDDGCGFDPSTVVSTAYGHLGLTLYAQASRAAGGRYSLLTAPGDGTRVRLQVPLRGGDHQVWQRSWRRTRSSRS